MGQSASKANLRFLPIALIWNARNANYFSNCAHKTLGALANEIMPDYIITT